MWRALVAVALFLVLAEAPASGAQALTPLEIDWEQIFRLECLGFSLQPGRADTSTYPSLAATASMTCASTPSTVSSAKRPTR
jgi:hypothetical protein